VRTGANRNRLRDAARVVSTVDASSSNGRVTSEAWSRSWTHLSIDRRSSRYCRVTFDHPPINAITAETVSELAELVDLIEHDGDLGVVVFDSANPAFYLAHHDVEHDPDKTPWPDLLVRLSRAPVVSIASIRGRAHGAGSEFVLACDMRFASRENTMLLLVDDLDGPRAEQFGYVNRTIPDERLDAEVDALASRLARLDPAAIARVKSYLNEVSLPADTNR
jgi:enoyl-CoA hydratase/carnithine racemase